MAKQAKNEIRLIFPSRSENERLARVAVSGFVSLYDPTLEELTDIKTAVSEAVTNSIVHAYRGTFGLIELTARAYNNNLIYIKIRDKGCGIPDIEKAMEPLFTTLPEEERSGLGFSVMESFCDSVKVTSKLSKGTTVILKKYLSKKIQG